MRKNIIGAYGCGNKGDDAILNMMYNVFGKDFEIIPTCGRYGHLEEKYKYNQLYLSCLGLRESCYRCPYAS